MDVDCYGIYKSQEVWQGLEIAMFGEVVTSLRLFRLGSNRSMMSSLVVSCRQELASIEENEQNIQSLSQVSRCEVRGG